jgi:hypothetical protein
MEYVSEMDFDVKVEGGSGGVVSHTMCRVFKRHGDRVGVLVNLPDGDFEEGLRTVAAWAWNSALEGGGRND